ncbi:MAG: hypothetical protein ABIQ74_02560 [Chitinophagales bacterium]
MTRQDLYDWLTRNGCEVDIIDDHRRSTAIKMTHPDAAEAFYMDTPINEKPVKSFTVSEACKALGVPFPYPFFPND